MPRVKRTVIDTNDVRVGQDQLHEIPATGSIDPADFTDQIQIVDGPALGDKAAQLAFMEEKVLVRIHPTSDKTKERIPCVAVNGQNQYIVRGRPQLIRRKFVEALARAVETAVETPFGRDANGFDTYNIAKTKSLKYPFDVVEDKNPRGRPWLEKILQEA